MSLESEWGPTRRKAAKTAAIPVGMYLYPDNKAAGLLEKYLIGQAEGEINKLGLRGIRKAHAGMYINQARACWVDWTLHIFLADETMTDTDAEIITKNLRQRVGATSAPSDLFRDGTGGEFHLIWGK